MRAVYSDRAADDLLAAVDWLSDTSIPAARRLIDAIDTACDVLGAFPYIGGQREWVADKTLRVLEVQGWFVVYRPNTNPPLILRIVYARGDLGSVEV